MSGRGKLSESLLNLLPSLLDLETLTSRGGEAK